MMWLYAYLITDFFILARFSKKRGKHLCLHPIVRTALCYFEASSKFDMNTIQNYLLLASNVCRYTQTVFNRNIYTEDSRLSI